MVRLTTGPRPGDGSGDFAGWEVGGIPVEREWHLRRVGEISQWRRTRESDGVSWPRHHDRHRHQRPGDFGRRHTHRSHGKTTRQRKGHSPHGRFQRRCRDRHARLLDEGLYGVRWSTDGRQIAFIHAGATAGDALWVADGDGTKRSEIVKAQPGMHVHWPAWSRDGFIYFIRTFTPVGNLDQADIYRINSRGGTIEPVVATARRAMFPLPTADAGGLIYAANPTTADLSLWWRPRAGGEPRRLTFGIGEFAEPRMSADGRIVVCTLYEPRQSLNRVSVTSSVAQIEPITDGYDGDLDPSVSPVGDRLVFNSSRAGNRNLWTMRLDGTDPRPLTFGPWNDDRPMFSPDGLQVAFVSDRDGQRGIWLVGRDGGSLRKLINAETLGALELVTRQQPNRVCGRHQRWAGALDGFGRGWT